MIIQDFSESLTAPEIDVSMHVMSCMHGSNVRVAIVTVYFKSGKIANLFFVHRYVRISV